MVTCMKVPRRALAEKTLMVGYNPHHEPVLEMLWAANRHVVNLVHRRAALDASDDVLHCQQNRGDIVKPQKLCDLSAPFVLK